MLKAVIERIRAERGVRNAPIEAFVPAVSVRVRARRTLGLSQRPWLPLMARTTALRDAGAVLCNVVPFAVHERQESFAFHRLVSTQARNRSTV